MRLRFWPVFLRNFLVWRKMIIPSLIANIAEPLMWLVAFGYGLARWSAKCNSVRRKYLTSCFWPAVPFA